MGPKKGKMEYRNNRTLIKYMDRGAMQIETLKQVEEYNEQSKR